MTDPFSAAGSVVGVISLGLSACQGLLQYYASWKDYENDVSMTMRSLESLVETFHLLEMIVKDRDLKPELAGRLEASIVACKDGVDSLKKKLEKIKQNGSPVSLQEKARSQARRVLYPFRQSTLVKLREIVSDLRNNVSLVMSTLQM